MERYFLFACVIGPALGTIPLLSAEAPERVSATAIYHESIVPADGAIGGTIILRPNGEFSSLLLYYTTSRAQVIQRGAPIVSPEKGTYVYTRTGHDRATLRFTSTTSSRVLEIGERSLFFSAAESGRVTVPVQT